MAEDEITTSNNDFSSILEVKQSLAEIKQLKSLMTPEDLEGHSPAIVHDLLYYRYLHSRGMDVDLAATALKKVDLL